MFGLACQWYRRYTSKLFLISAQCGVPKSRARGFDGTTGAVVKAGKSERTRFAASTEWSLLHSLLHRRWTIIIQSSSSSQSLHPHRSPKSLGSHLLDPLLRPLHNPLLIINLPHNSIPKNSLTPLPKVRQRLQLLPKALGHQLPIPRKRKHPQHKRRRHDLRQSQLRAPAEKRPSPNKQGLNLPLHHIHALLGFRLLLRPSLRFEDLKLKRRDFRTPRIDEKRYACAFQRGERVFLGSGQERGGEGVAEELRDDGGFGEGFRFVEDAREGVFDRGDEAAGVDVEVPLRAGGVEVDEDFFVFCWEGGKGG